MIIYLCGHDASGKTTLSKLLVIYFRKLGLPAKYSWMRGTHTLISILAQHLRHYAVFQGKDNPYYKIRIPKKAKRLWQLLEYISALPIILSRYILPSIIGKLVIGDRYTLDLITWIITTTHDPTFLRTLMGKHLLLLSRKALGIHVIASNIKGRPLDVPESFLNLQREIYEKIAKQIPKIDTYGSTPIKAMNDILKILKERYHVYLHDQSQP